MDKHRYKLRTLRADDLEWEEFKDKRRQFGKSWNLFIKHINNLLEGKEQQ